MFFRSADLVKTFPACKDVKMRIFSDLDPFSKALWGMKKALRVGEPYWVDKDTIEFYGFQIRVNLFNLVTYSGAKE